jgi:UDP-2,3-diacylglucosamine pyrophosphatase LpxH
LDQIVADTPRHYRTIWISDIHLGTRACRADLLLDFLRRHDAEFIYLVGDIVDGWELKKSWYWPQSHNDVIQKILRKVRKGTRVTYIAGNHDVGARLFVNLSFGGVLFRKDAMHRTADDKVLWVTHGDRFDAAIRCSPLLAWLGGWGYDVANTANALISRIRSRLHLPHWSLAAEIKRRSRQVETYLAAFERAAVDAARRRGADGVVCGHIHTTAIRTIDGIIYCNDGDWVENCSALVEHQDGRLETLWWNEAPGLAAHRPYSEMPAQISARPAVPLGASS